MLTLFICLGIAWFLASYKDGVFSLLFWTPGIYLATKLRWRSVAVFVLLTPLSVAFFNCAREYVAGSSRYVAGRSGVLSEQGSIDPITRIRGRNPGCGTHSPSYWIESTAEHLAGSVMYRLIGPPPGAYTGPYPTEDEAIAALSAATPFQISDDWDGRIPLPTGIVTVDPEWFYARVALRKGGPAPPPNMLTPSAVTWRARCVVVKVPRDVDNGPYADVYMIDAQKPEVFRMFRMTK